MDSMDALGFRCAGSMGVIIVRVWVLLVMGALVSWTLSPSDVLEFGCTGSMDVGIGFPCADADAQRSMHVGFRFAVSDAAVSVGRWFPMHSFRCALGL